MSITAVFALNVLKTPCRIEKPIFIFRYVPNTGRYLYLVFFQGLTPPLHPAPGTTRSDVTLARECQRLGASGCFSAKFSFRPPAYKSGWNAAE